MFVHTLPWLRSSHRHLATTNEINDTEIVTIDVSIIIPWHTTVHSMQSIAVVVVVVAQMTVMTSHFVPNPHWYHIDVYFVPFHTVILIPCCGTVVVVVVVVVDAPTVIWFPWTVLNDTTIRLWQYYSVNHGHLIFVPHPPWLVQIDDKPIIIDPYR